MAATEAVKLLKGIAEDSRAEKVEGVIEEGMLKVKLPANSAMVFSVK